MRNPVSGLLLLLSVLFEGWTVLGQASGLTFPGTTVFPDEGWVSVTNDFALSDPLSELKETWISLGKVDFPLEARVNGVFLYRRGTVPPDWPFVQTSNPAVFLVPTPVWNAQGLNRLELRIWKEGDRLKFSEPLLVVGPHEADFQRGTVQFLNSTLFLMFFGINLLGGIYFFVLWAGRPKQIDQLYFSISTLLIGFYFLSLGSPIPLFPGVLHYSLLKACLGMSIAFLVLFLLEHFQVLNYLWLKLSVLAVFSGFSLFVAFSLNMTQMADRFTLSMIPLEVGILFTIVLMVIALKRKLPQARIMAVGIGIGVAFGSHDVWYQMTGQVPVAWLQGVGFFSLEGSMFFSLAIHSTQMYTKLESTAVELLHQKGFLAQTNEAFARFVPRELLRFLGKDSVMDVRLGDQVQETMTILFSDIRNFTRMTESLTPRESFNLLNSYLARMGPSIRAHGGTVDKYIGDAIMALFPASPLKAVEGALAMRESLRDYNKGRERAGYQPLEMGIGLHTGPVMLGTIGEDQRMDGTVISDAVNTSSRIEGLTKAFKVPIIVSQATLAADPLLVETIAHRYLGLMQVRGRTQGLALYEILDPQDPLTPTKLQHKDLFEAAVRSQEEGDARASTNLFLAYQAKVPDDTCVSFFLERLQPAGTPC